jgi:hypothetical protein
MSLFYRVLRVIEQSDVLLEILDARFPEHTRNPSLEHKIVSEGKKLVLIMNKSDLISLKQAKSFKESLEIDFPVVFLSSKNRKGIKRLKGLLDELGKEKKIKAGVIGYPNTGKSSLINALRGRHVAPTSIRAGFTVGEKLIRLSDKISLIDGPGIIPLKERDEFFLVLIGAKNPDRVKDAELIALKLIDLIKKGRPEKFEARYKAKLDEKEPEEILEEVALKQGMLLKQGLPNLEAIARRILFDWQKGFL